MQETTSTSSYIKCKKAKVAKLEHGRCFICFTDSTFEVKSVKPGEAAYLLEIPQTNDERLNGPSVEVKLPEKIGGLEKER